LAPQQCPARHCNGNTEHCEGGSACHQLQARYLAIPVAGVSRFFAEDSRHHTVRIRFPICETGAKWSEVERNPN
jgi:hypothetical protein